MATLPSSWAGRLANAPLNAPTGVRAALTMTISSCHARNSFRVRLDGADAGSAAAFAVDYSAVMAARRQSAPRQRHPSIWPLHMQLASVRTQPLS